VALTSQQIIALACQDAKVPGWTQQAGQHMIAVLDELCETYDWEATKVNFNGALNPAVQAVDPNIVAGQGPSALPAGYLRMVPRTFVYLFNGVPYPLTNWEDADFDSQVQQVGIASLARDYITDLSNPAAPVFFIYPPTNGAYPYRGRCHIRMPDIGSSAAASLTGWVPGVNPPESSAVIPWFPNTTYLRTRIAGELMKGTGDKRAAEFLGKGPEGAQGILDRLLQMVDDKQSRAQKISLDRRTFRYNQQGLPDTKNIFG